MKVERAAAKRLSASVFFCFLIIMLRGWGGGPRRGPWRCFLVKRGGHSPPTRASHSFRRTYNLTRVLMSVANKYSNDRRRARRPPGGGGSGTEREVAAVRGEALLAKYLGGQSGGRAEGRRRAPGGAADVPGPAPADVLSAYCRRGHALQYCVRSAILPLSNSI